MRSKTPLIFFLFVFLLPLISCDPNATDPNADPRDKYIGTWTVTPTIKKVTYQVEITADPSNSIQVLISDFYNFGIQPYAIATSSTLTIPQQNFPSQGIKVWGTGSYSSKKIIWVYYVNDGANQDTIRETYTLQ